MENCNSRTEMLLGCSAMDKLKSKRVAVFGIGGVGGYVVEAIARVGVGTIDVIDNDVISESNLNRQIIALNSTLGRCKVDVMQERINDINPNIKVNKHKVFYLPESDNQIDFTKFDYVVDAVDTVTAKLGIIVECKKCGIPVISSMGTANKLEPTCFKVADIKDTKMCPLSRIMRKELKNRGIDSLKVVYSEEMPVNANQIDTDNTGNKKPIGSVSFVPSVAGLIIAGEVIKDLIK